MEYEFRPNNLGSTWLQSMTGGRPELSEEVWIFQFLYSSCTISTHSSRTSEGWLPVLWCGSCCCFQKSYCTHNYSFFHGLKICFTSQCLPPQSWPQWWGCPSPSPRPQCTRIGPACRSGRTRWECFCICRLQRRSWKLYIWRSGQHKSHVTVLWEGRTDSSRG